MITKEHFLQARERIKPYLAPTPLFKSEKIQQRLGVSYPIYLKLECEQPTGSFKVRGAFNSLLNCDSDKVVAFSSGNFAQAVAYGAYKLGKKAILVIPSDAPKIKIEGTRKYNADIVFCGLKHEDGFPLAEKLEEEGHFLLHPFNNLQIVAGQGTLALELLETNPKLSNFFSPVGGGGLLSGCATCLKQHNPEIKTYAVEPFGAHDFYHSFSTKQHQTFKEINTIADGLRSSSVGSYNFPLLLKNVDQALHVKDEAIIEAMKWLWEDHQLIVEPSGAVALAGFISLHEEIQGETVILITGKNVDIESFNKWINHG